MRKAPRAGRKPRLSEADRRRIIAGLKRGPEALGYETGLWTAPRVTKLIEDECNKAIEESLPVRIYEEDRVKIEKEIGDRSLVDLIPKHITRLRVIRVGDRDYCPCGGTHLKNTAEIGRVHVLERRSKGKDTDRIAYELGAASP